MTTPLKQSQFAQCAQQIARMGNDDSRVAQRFGGRNVDDALFREFRQFKLTETLHYAYEHSARYRQAFEGIDLDAVRVDDLSALPFTTADDLASTRFGYLCCSQTKVPRIFSFASSGTLGPQKSVYFTERDLDDATTFMDGGIATVTSPGDVVQILLPGGSEGGQADLLARGVLKAGATPLVTGMDLSFEEQVQAMRDHGSTVLFGESHLIYRLTKAMEDSCDLRSLGVRTLFLTTSYVSPVMRMNLEQAWGAKVHVHYGMTEMGLGLAVTCPVCGGMHYNQLGVILEVVDPETGAPVAPSQTGEIVATSLGRQAMPVIRFRTGDAGSIRPADPACPSAPFDVVSDVPFRWAAGVSLGSGTTVYPTTFHDTLFAFPQVIDYELTVANQRGLSPLVLLVLVEAKGASAELAGRIERNVRAALPADLGLGVQVRFMDHEALRQGRHFKKLIHDERSS